jgi:hypothetical protein
MICQADIVTSPLVLLVRDDVRRDRFLRPLAPSTGTP